MMEPTMENVESRPAGPGTRPRLSVIVSFRNEEDNIPELLRRTRTTLQAEVRQGTLSSYELVFVNDASTDRSLELLEAAARGRDDIRVVNMSRNFGHDPCALAGMEFSSGDLVVCIDGDLQDPPELIPDLVRAWSENPGVEVVHTVRRSRAGESRVKLWITALGYRILKAVSSVDILIEAGDFKLLTRRAVHEMVQLREKQPFLRGMVRWIGLRQTQIQYDREPRFAGNASPVLSSRVIRYFFEAALISYSGAPLQISTVLGGLMTLASFLLSAGLVIEGLAGYAVSGWAVMTSVLLFLGGMQMLMLGVIGLYLYSMYVELKHRPNYIVDSKVGYEFAQGQAGPRQFERQAA
jgi:glycosyltransferase involved in cell wall biosynthesis